MTGVISPRAVLIFGSLAGILCHALFGFTAAVARKLQLGSTPMPTFALLFLSNLFSLLCYIPIGSYKFYKLTDKRDEMKYYFKNFVVYVFAISMTLASMFKMLSSKYTSAVFAQLSLQMTPFVVTLFSFFLLREMITKIAVICLGFTVGGGVLVMIAGSSRRSTANWTMNWTIDFGHIGSGFDWTDLIGIGFGLASAVGLAMFTISIKYATAKSKRKIEKLALMGAGLVVMITSYGALSLIFQENWFVMLQFGSTEWIYLIVYILATTVGLYAEMYAIPIIGPSWFSSVMALRLVVTVISSWPILQEQMDNIWQFVGCGIVIVGVSVFLFHSALNEKPKVTPPTVDPPVNVLVNLTENLESNGDNGVEIVVDTPVIMTDDTIEESLVPEQLIPSPQVPPAEDFGGEQLDQSLNDKTNEEILQDQGENPHGDH
jgi:drug/metabolite transporter (DMT)-like permease